MARGRPGRQEAGGRGGGPPPPAQPAVLEPWPGSHLLESGSEENRLSLAGGDVSDECIGAFLVLRRANPGDGIGGDHILVVGDRDPVDLATGDDVADVDDSGSG